MEKTNSWTLLMPQSAPQVFIACLSDRDEALPAGIPLWETPEEASCPEGRLVVVAVPPTAVQRDGRIWRLQEALPASVMLNRSPYRPPVTVPAAGGVIVRGKRWPEVLLIYRRGRWDLPKGKCDPGESPEACALREVSEELGIDPGTLQLREPLGHTVHAYPLDGHYAVKPTRWFLMETVATTFSPQTSEDIQEVRWFSLAEAYNRVTYPTLRALLHRLKARRALPAQGC